MIFGLYLFIDCTFFLHQAKRTLKAQKLQDELASGKLDQTVSPQQLNIIVKTENIVLDLRYVDINQFSV